MAHRLQHVCCAALWLFLAAEARAGAPVVEVRTSSGKTVSAPLARLGVKWDIRVGGSEPAAFEVDDWLDFRRAGADLPERPTSAQLILTNGDCLPIRDAKLDGEQVRCHLDDKDGTEWTTPLATVGLIWLSPPSDRAEREKAQRRWTSDKRTRDLVRLRNGDTVEGVLNGVDASTVSVEVEKKKVELSAEKVAAIALSTELSSVPKPKGVHGRLVLSNGARLTLKAAECADGETLTATTIYNTALKLKVADVAALYLVGGKAVYLSDLKPGRFEGKPYSDLEWPPGWDASVSGRDLRVGGSTFDKGIGLHSESRLTFDLGGNYRSFEAWVGLEEQDDGSVGTARIKVLVDGKERPLEGDLAGKGKPLNVRLEVSGAKELTLVVEFGKKGDVLGRVNWGDARLVK